MNRINIVLIILSPILCFLVVSESPGTEAESPTISGTLGSANLWMKKWDDLSKEIVPKIVESNLDIITMSRYFSRAECELDVSMQAPVKGECGRIAYSWYDRNNNGALSTGEVKVKELLSHAGKMEINVSEAKRIMESDAFFGVFGLFGNRTVKSRKSADGYSIRVDIEHGIMDYISAPRIIQLKIDRDFRIARIRYRLSDEQEWSVRKFRHKKVDNKWLLISLRESTPIPGGIVRKERTYSYEFKGEVPFPKSIVQTSIFPSAGQIATLKAEFGEWKLKKRKTPFPIFGSPQNVDPDLPPVEINEDEWEPDDDPWQEPGKSEDGGGGGLWGDDYEEGE